MFCFEFVCLICLSVLWFAIFGLIVCFCVVERDIGSVWTDLFINVNTSSYCTCMKLNQLQFTLVVCVYMLQWMCIIREYVHYLNGPANIHMH